MRQTSCGLCGNSAQETAHIKARRAFENEVIDQNNTVELCGSCHTKLDTDRTIAFGPSGQKYITLGEDGQVLQYETARQLYLRRDFIKWRNDYSKFQGILQELGWPLHEED